MTTLVLITPNTNLKIPKSITASFEGGKIVQLDSLKGIPEASFDICYVTSVESKPEEHLLVLPQLYQKMRLDGEFVVYQDAQGPLVKELAVLSGLFLREESEVEDGFVKMVFGRIAVVKKTIDEQKEVGADQKSEVLEEQKLEVAVVNPVVVVNNPFVGIELGDDLVNEDDLLGDIGNIKDYGGESCATKKKACKGCTCGRKEEEDS